MRHKPPVRSRVAPPTSWMAPLMSARQKRVLTVFFVAWLASLANFFAWWANRQHIVGFVGITITTAVIGFTLLLPVWLFYTAARATSTSPDLMHGRCRIAMIVTKTPAEPWPMVRATLRAMQTQDYDHPYDVWLADEDPAEETLHWCAANNVRVSSRHNVADYHRKSWPRRTKSKEGNLSFFYDHWGYRDYDIVCHFDADHVAQPDYLRAILRGFAHPRVGYVAAPSICSTKSSGSWTARGRLYKEATLHGLLQAGHNRGFGPACIGSHYAVRTKALRQIGGIGPELAEDFSTSYLLASHGWAGVFAIDAIAHGDGPLTFVDGMTQELQWSRSLTTFFLRYTPGHWRNLLPTERFRFGFAQIWYPLFAVHMLVASLLAPIAVIADQPWVSVTFLGFVFHSAVPTMVIVGLTLWFRQQRWLRPEHVPIVSWEAALFAVTRWPWNLLGVFQALAGWISGREFRFRITPKSQDCQQRLPWTIVAPYALIVAIQSAAVLSSGLRPRAVGYVWLSAIGTIIYTAVVLAVVTLHLKENDSGHLRQRLRTNASAVAVAAVLVVAAAAVTVKAIVVAVSIWPELNISTELVGTSELTTTAALVYLGALIALAIVWATMRGPKAAPPEIDLTDPLPSPRTAEPAHSPIKQR